MEVLGTKGAGKRDGRWIEAMRRWKATMLPHSTARLRTVILGTLIGMLAALAASGCAHARSESSCGHARPVPPPQEQAQPTDDAQLAFDAAQEMRLLKSPYSAAQLTDEDWSDYIEVARLLQRLPAKRIAAVLRDDISAILDAPPSTFGVIDAEMRAYVLIRIVYEFPRVVPLESHHQWMGWLFEGGGAPYIHGDWADPSWPLVWIDGKPRMVFGRMSGRAGPPYPVELDVEWAAASFPLRDLGRGGINVAR